MRIQAQLVRARVRQQEDQPIVGRRGEHVQRAETVKKHATENAVRPRKFLPIVRKHGGENGRRL